MDDLLPPTIYIIAGPNGAGKTTFANSFLPTFAKCREFLNADLIAAGLSPFDPESQAIRASELLLLRIDELVASRSSFSFETTLAARSYRKSVGDWNVLGYQVFLIYLWLPSADLAVERVATRVKEGGYSME
jgi:predicted ABC-type ATPase